MSLDSTAPAGDLPADSTEIDRLLDRLTARLRVDPELRLEVRQELRSHLEESIAEFRKGGRNEADARAEAIAALGDEKELAEQLWRANRRRLRVRLVATWAARLVLPLVALLLIAQLNQGVVTAWALAYQLYGGGAFWGGPPRAIRIANDYRDAVIATAPPDVQKLFHQEDARDDERLKLARELAEAHPEDHALYANYAACAMMRNPIRFSSYTEQPKIDQPMFDDTLAILAEGERREPDNALYPLLSSGLLFEASFVEQPDPALVRQLLGRKVSEEWARAQVFDRQRYARALEALHRAAAKPYLRAYTAELERRRLEAIPIRRVADVWLRVGEEVRTLMPTLNEQRSAIWGAGLRATDALREGKRDEADRLLRDLRILPGLAAAGADKEIELHVADGALSSALTAEAFARQVAGDKAGTDAAWDRVREHNNARNRLFAWDPAQMQAEKRHAGMLYSTFGTPFTSAPTADAGPMRRAEYAAFDQLGFGAIASAVMLLALVYAIVAAIAWLAGRRESRPPRLFIGWRRVMWTVALGAVLPVAIYFVYADLTPLGGRGDGLNVTLGRVSAEYAVLAAVVMLLLGAMTRRAVRRRAQELGMTPWPPESASLSRRATMAGAALLSLACLIGAIATGFEWVQVPLLPNKSAWIAPVVLILGCWMLLAGSGLLQVMRDHSRNARLFHAGVVARSAFPVVLIAAVILSLLGLPLRWTESRQVAAAARASGTISLINGIAAPRYQTLRQRLIDQREATLHVAQ